jgi:hypothetical protein
MGHFQRDFFFSFSSLTGCNLWLLNSRPGMEPQLRKTEGVPIGPLLQLTKEQTLLLETGGITQNRHRRAVVNPRQKTEDGRRKDSEGHSLRCRLPFSKSRAGPNSYCLSGPLSGLLSGLLSGF